MGDAVGVAKKSRGPNRKKVNAQRGPPQKHTTLQQTLERPVNALFVQDLEKFLETGVHPEFQRSRGQAAVTSLPEQSTTRPYVFMEFAVDKQTVGAERCGATAPLFALLSSGHTAREAGGPQRRSGGERTPPSCRRRRQGGDRAV